MSAVDSIFGRIVTGDDVEEACMVVLKRWSSTYLAELERQHGIEAGTLARIRSFTTTPTFDKFPEDQLPALLLVSVGLAERPTRRGGTVYDARFLLGLGLVCSAAKMEDSHRQAELYVAAHRALLLQRQSLDGWGADGTDWLDERYDDLPYDDARSLGWGIAHFTVQVNDVVTVHAGPTGPDLPPDPPDTDPFPDWPEVTATDVEVFNAAPNGGSKGGT